MITMKKLVICLVLLCGFATIATSCKKDNEVVPETNEGTMVMGTKTMDIAVANAVGCGERHAILLASDEITHANNEGIAVVFEGDIVPGRYDLGDSKEAAPRVVGLKNYNMGELHLVIGMDSLYFGDVYYWIEGELSVTEHNGTYTVVLSHCVATNNDGASISLSVNFNGVLPPLVLSTENKFTVKGRETPISLAGLTSIGMSDNNGNFYGTKSMVFLSPNHKVAFIVSYLNNSNIDGEYTLSALIPYVPSMPCVHYVTDFDLWSSNVQTGYVAEGGTLKVQTAADGTRTVLIQNAKLRNLEHPDSIFFPVIDASLSYQGLMYEIELK